MIISFQLPPGVIHVTHRLLYSPACGDPAEGMGSDDMVVCTYVYRWVAVRCLTIDERWHRERVRLVKSDMPDEVSTEVAAR